MADEHFDVEPLIEWARKKQLSREQQKTLSRAAAKGRITLRTADRIVTSLGGHPSEVWGNYFDRRLTESEWQQRVIDLAHLFGWRVAHFRPARTQTGWRTPVAADAAGFPDLILVRDRLIAAELKTERGTVSWPQQQWLDALQAAGVETHVWRPSDWADVQHTLQKRQPGSISSAVCAPKQNRRSRNGGSGSSTKSPPPSMTSPNR